MHKSLKDQQMHFGLMDVILVHSGDQQFGHMVTTSGDRQFGHMVTTSGDQQFGHMVTTMQLEKWRALKLSGPLEGPYAPFPPHSMDHRSECTCLDYGTVWGMWQVFSECNETSVYRGDHTEAIEIDYDPNEVSYSELLGLFWKNHDPTARTSKQVCGLTQKRKAYLIH